MRMARDTAWDRQWQAAWKAHPANPWFHYQADAFAAWVRARVPGTLGGRACTLKTDAFEEACGFDQLWRTLGATPSVLMDVSPRILSHARRTLGRDGRGAACASDVRRLAFRSGSFDLVLSHSTLDHFAVEADIAVALREILGVLRPRARLLITLDNPANPVLCVRRLLHRLTGPVGGLIPFPMGRTLSRARLAALLEQEGFEVLDSGYLLHAPRILGLWLGEWAARRRLDGLAGRLRRLFGRVDSALAAWPTRRWTAHFVAVDCRRPDTRPTRDTQANGRSG